MPQEKLSTGDIQKDEVKSKPITPSKDAIQEAVQKKQEQIKSDKPIQKNDITDIT